MRYTKPEHPMAPMAHVWEHTLMEMSAFGGARVCPERNKTPAVHIAQLLLRRCVFYAITSILGLFSTASSAFANPNQYEPVFMITTRGQADNSPRPAFVEPWVLTDGGKFVFVYDYCRSFVERKRLPLTDRQLGEHAKWVKNFCVDQPVTLPGGNIIGRDNWGTEIIVGAVNLRGASYNGTTTVHLRHANAPVNWTKTLGIQPDATIGFYTAAGSEKLLRRLIPVVANNGDELGRKSDIAKQKIGLDIGSEQNECFNWAGSAETCSADGWERRREPYKWPKDLDAQISTALLADLDGDGTNEAVLGFQVPQTRIEETRLSGWHATAVVFEKNSFWVRGIITQIPIEQEYDLSKYESTAYFPRGVLRFGQCSYVAVSFGSSHLQAISLATVPRNTANCRSRRALKFWDMDESGERTSWVGRRARDDQ